MVGYASDDPFEAARAPRLDFATIEDEDIEQAVNGTNLFGWGKNSYDAGTDTITLRFLFGGSDIPYWDLPPDVWLLSSIHSHEIGHYLLASLTRLGITIRKLAALIDGLVMCVAQDMLADTGKVWVPFDMYLADHDKTKLANLIRAVKTLDLLRMKLTSGWRVSHELFTLCLSGMEQSVVNLLFNHSNLNLDECVRAISILTDEALVDRVLEPVLASLGRERVCEGPTPTVDEWRELFEAAERIFHGADKRRAIQVLEVLKLVVSRSSTDNERPSCVDEPPSTSFLSYMGEIASGFEKGKSEHKAALAIYAEFGRGVGAITKIMGLIGVLSNLYAPKLPVARFAQWEDCFQALPDIDGVLEVVLKQYMPEPVESLFAEPQRASREICHVQRVLGSVTLRELKDIRAGDILGTPEWFEGILSHLRLDRQRKNMLRGLLAGSQAESGGFLCMVSSQGKRIIPFGLARIFDIFFAARHFVRNRFRNLTAVYRWLESLGLASSGAVKNAVSLYNCFASFLTITDIRRLYLPSVSICYSGRQIVIAFGASEMTTRVKHVVLRSFLDRLRCTMTSSRNMSPVVLCPLGLIENNFGACSFNIKSCTVGGLARLLGEGAIIICSRTYPARLLRFAFDQSRFEEVGRVAVKAHKRSPDEESEEDNASKTGHENTPKPPPIDWRRPLHSSSCHPTATVVGQFLGMMLVRMMKVTVGALSVPIDSMIKLWAYRNKRRQHRMDRNIEQSIRSAWDVLRELARASKDQTGNIRGQKSA